MKKIYLLTFWIALVMNQGNNANGQTVKRDDWNEKKANSWLKSGDWKNGLTTDVHPSVNATEFAYQYHKNKALWDKAFEFLKNTRLDTLAPGKHIIDGDNLFVSIAEGPVKNFEETKWEAHKKYIDIQYVIYGKETMGVISIDKVTATDSFDEAKDLGFFTAPEQQANYYEANPKAFLIFFPSDAHRPGIKIAGTDVDKKLVVKIIAD
jgi:YhcH/YjgK/YiaL family protein